MRKRSKKVVPYQVQFESDYKIGDVVEANDNETGRKRPGTFTLMRQFGGKTSGWSALRKWGSGVRYREEYVPIHDEDIREWVDFNKKIHQPKIVIPLSA